MALNREKVVRNAEKLVSRGKLEAAIKEYRKVLKENPNDTNTLNRVGDLYARLERFDEAVRLFSQIAEKYTDDGFFVKAIAIYKKIIKFDPSSLPVYERLADLYYRQGLTNESRNQYQFLADYYLKNNNLTSATNIFQRMAEVEPDDPSHRLKLADLYEKQRFPDRAVREYQAIADIVLRANSPDQAVHVYAKALQLAPEDLGLVRSAVRSLYDGGHMGAAAKVLAKAVDLNPAAKVVANELKLSEPEASGAAAEQGTGTTQVPKAAAADDPFAVPDDSFDIDSAADEAMDAVDAAEGEDFDHAIEVAADEAALDLDGDASEYEIQPPADMADGPGTGFGDVEFEVELEGDFDDVEDEADVDLDEADFSEIDLDEVDLDEVDVGDDVESDVELELEAEDEEPSRATSPAMDVDFAGMDDDLAVELEDEPVEIADDEPQIESEIELDFELEAPVEALAEDVAEVVAEEDLSDDATPVRREEDLLAEAKVFQKYGLADKARDRLSELLEVNAEHLEGLQLLAAMELEAEDVPAAEALAQRLEEASTAAGDAAFYDQLRSDFAAQGLMLGALDVPSARVAPVVEDDLLVEDETAISAGVELDALDLEPEPVDESGIAPEPELEPEYEEPEPVAEIEFEPAPELAMPEPAATEPSAPEPEKPARAKKGKPRDRIAQLLEDLSLDAFDAPSRKPRREAEPDVAEPAARAESAAPAPEPAASEPAAPEPAAPEPAAPGPVVSAPATPEPAAQTPARVGALFSLKEELDLDDIVDQEELEAVEAVSGDDLDATGMSWLDDEEPQAAAVAAGGDADEGESLFDEEDDFFDLAAELEAELGVDAAKQVGDGVSSLESQEGTLEEIIEGFKQGVAEHLSEEDYDTHFNLGIAYREMGLLDEAIGEFQVSSKDDRFLAESASMLGMCFLEKGLPELAVRWYKKGLEAPEVSEEATLGLLYDLATTYESMGESESAYRTFVEIFGINTNFRDVASKMQELAPQQQA